MGMNSMAEGLDLLAEAVAGARRRERPPLWATVVSLSPLQVALDDDPDATPLEVASSAVGGDLQLGWGVLVQIGRTAGRRRITVLAAPDQVADFISTVQPWGGRIFTLESTVNTTPSTRNATLRSDITALQSAVGGLPEIQSGTASMNISASTVAAGVVGNITITFPKAFGSAPRVMLNTRGTAQALQQFKLHTVSVATGSVSVRASSTIANNLAVNNVPIEWLAIN